MRRPTKSSSRKISADSQRLVTLAQSHGQAASRMEQREWERQLEQLLQAQLASNQQLAIDNALDHLFHADGEAYDDLLDIVEAVSCSCTLEHNGQHFDALLIAMPILSWTRFTIASGPIQIELLQSLTTQLVAHILASDVHIAIAPHLFSIDQLPRSYCETYALTRRMAQASISQTALAMPIEMPDTAPFLADTRQLLFVITAEHRKPLLRWQEDNINSNLQISTQAALTQWQVHATPILQKLLPGCGIELLLPEAYFVACRNADKMIRPISIRAAVHYLTHALNIDAGQLQAVVASVGDDSHELRIDEYRVSFSVVNNPDVFYGVIWPLYDEESGEEDAQLSSSHALNKSTVSPLQQIVILLRESGITHITKPDMLFPPECCDDCGAPLFCDQAEEMVHAEMPEDSVQQGGHLH
jgi:hypothetical protein